MSLVSLEECKTFMEITDSDSDASINQLIPMAEALFYGMLRVDTLEENTTDEIAYIRNREIWFKNFPIITINEIGGETYDGVSFDDYIATKNKVEFDNPDFWDKIKGNNIKVNYTSGYLASEIPYDLKLAIFILVSGLYNTKENYGTTECKIWQENIKFRDTTESEDFQRILKIYKKKFIQVM